MNYPITPYSRALEPFAWWDEGFTKEELDWLQQKAREAKTEAIVGRNRLDTNIRRSEVNWLEVNSETEWIFKRLNHIAASLNARFFGFDLSTFGEALQLTNYHESKQGTYGWHQDFGAEAASRKLSLVMQLSEPEEYEGGNLELMTTGEPFVMQKKRGLLIAFPTWTLHRVTPVIKGSRQSLVSWVSGPQFR